MIPEGITDIFDEQARLNQKKRQLSFRNDQTAADWLELAREYQEIDSRANFAHCTRKAIALGAKIEHKTDELPPEYDWQTRKDVGL